VDIKLTEVKKGNETLTIRKECPSCKAVMVFGILNGKLVIKDDVIHWISNNNQLVRCINCDTVYRLDIIDT
jgi:hypothetical protein